MHRRFGPGPAALLLHCALASHRALLRLAQHLPADWSLALPDHPGHGQSADWDGIGDYHAVATDAATALCDGPTHLIGHSLGGTVALRLACQRPDLVSRLTLIEPVFFALARDTPEFAATARDEAPFAAALDRGDLPAAAQAFHAVWGAGGTWAALPRTTQDAFIRQMPLVAASIPAQTHDTAGLLAPGRMEAITCPVRLIRGGASPPVIGAIHRALLARLPQATDHVVPGAGHMVAITHAARVAEAIGP